MEWVWWGLAASAFFAGLIDAIAGGGGLIQLPSLLAAFPEQGPATLFGTNKSASIWGTLTAASRYWNRVKLEWGVLLPALLAALLGGWCGARAVSLLPVALLRPAILGLLIIVAYYTFTRHELGLAHVRRHSHRTETVYGVLIGAGMGFYDGIFGPGTGAFLVFLFVRVLGYDFLHASAFSKLVNCATNIAALGFFIPAGHVLWKIAGIMALCNVGGAFVGTSLALKHGSRFVRWIFLVVVLALIAKIGHLTLVAAP
ncbi:MAG: sulfite exporter TauE/SafE family protein [Gammaproteobacteria bacterium]|nr:sulfite exporter TauE/SafE family protein [Gammaproteobacteria bacterium]